MTSPTTTSFLVHAALLATTVLLPAAYGQSRGEFGFADAKPTKPDSKQTTPRVGTWNIEHFGNRHSGRRTQSDYKAIAKLIHEIGIDVMAVQEIGRAEALRTLVRTLGKNWEFVLGRSGGFREDDGRISVGFIWNKDAVDCLEASELTELPREMDGQPIFHRVPVTAVFRARGKAPVDFRAISVHLKAGIKAKDKLKRTLETAALRTWIEGKLADHGEDHDLVVLGDFNHSPDMPAFASFTKGKALKYLTPPINKPTIIHFDNPIDHIAITKDFGQEVVASTHVVHFDRAEADRDAWRSTYSDHVPVTVDLKVSVDHDKTSFAPAKLDALLPVSKILPMRKMPPRTSNSGGSTPSPTGANPPSTGSVPEPFRAGQRVKVVMSPTGHAHTGELASPPGDWVYLKVGRKMYCFPSTSIREIIADSD